MLTRKEVCYWLKVSRWTLWRWENEELPLPIVGGRVPASVVMMWLELREAREAERLKG